MSVWRGIVAILVTPVVLLGIILSPIILLAIVIYAFLSIDKKELEDALRTSSDDDLEDPKDRM